MQDFGGPLFSFASWDLLICSNNVSWPISSRVTYELLSDIASVPVTTLTSSKLTKNKTKPWENNEKWCYKLKGD